MNDALYDLLGYDTCLLRRPTAATAREDGRIRELARELGMSIIMWRRSVHDSHVPTPAAEEIAARALLEVMRTAAGSTAQSCCCTTAMTRRWRRSPPFCPHWSSGGYQLVTDSDCLMSTEGGMNPGGVYRCRD